MDYKQWCIEQHRKTNHFYDTYLPYEFHLRMVNNVYEDFKEFLDDKHDYFGDHLLGFRERPETLREVCAKAVWGHDLIEDCRVSFNDCSTYLGQAAAEIIYAVTNEKGKNRKERANKKYYEGIRDTPGAVFVKLCDRIANVQYSRMTKSRMFETYKKENDEFVMELAHEPLELMFDYLNNLFNVQLVP